MDEGWTRWLLERYESQYTTLVDADVRAGALRTRLDVIILPAQSPESIVHGHSPSPPARRDAPSNPVPPEYQGGIGDAGVDALKQFVREGGTLVTFDDASDLVLDRFGARSGISDVTRGLDRAVFYCPGSVLRIAADTTEPVAWGMGPDTAAYFQGSRAFDTSDPSVHSAARYAPADAVLIERVAARGGSHRQPSRGAGCALRQGPRRSLCIPAAIPGAAARHVQAAVQRATDTTGWRLAAGGCRLRPGAGPQSALSPEPRSP